MQLHYHAPSWSLTFLLLAVVFMIQHSTALVSKADLPREMQDCYNQYSRFSLRDVVGQSVCWACEAPAIMRIRAEDRPPISTPSARAYVSHLLRIITDCLNGYKSSNYRKCTRREYRTLSDEERNRFHGALNTLKADTTVDPNKYDAIARFHSGNVIAMAHNGPNFLGWHRVYLLVLELALQEVDPYICLPYWDSSLDSELDDPTTSYVFSADFLGGGTDNRTVTDGPFAQWVTPDWGPLIRNIGASGQLYNLTSIRKILSQRRVRDISPPTALPKNGLEYNHNGIHVYIGGQMNDLQSAAHDPVFFLHHAFVDYLWEAFRNKQRASGIDPEQDFPVNIGSPLHAPDNLIGVYDLNITVYQGYSNRLKDTYDYIPTPSCSSYRPSCGSKYLQCNVQRGRCAPVNPYADPLGCSSSRRKLPIGVQNTYCIDGVCDMRGWVYVPVKVVSMRSPDLRTYESFPVYNGSVWEANDIYQPAAYTETSGFISDEAPMSYDKCDGGNGIGQIYIQSNGLSYNGFYKESVIIDQRLATAIAVGYIAVKDPRDGPVKAIFRAFDSCGRICNTAFRTGGSRRFEPFSGVVHIEDVPGHPKQYSYTYGQATLETWGYSSNHDCPGFLDDDIVVSFYCDYNQNIPWSKTRGNPDQRPRQDLSQNVVPPSNLFECKVDEDCTIDVSCAIANGLCSGEGYKCRGTCNRYVICSNGQYTKKSCPYDWSFDHQQGTCSSHRRCSSSATLPFMHGNQFQSVNNNHAGSFFP